MAYPLTGMPAKRVSKYSRRVVGAGVATVGLFVGADVGLEVGLLVGSLVGAWVGTFVGTFVG